MLTRANCQRKRLRNYALPLAETMPSMPSPPLPEPGQIVIVRQRPFVVSDIESSTLPLPATVQDRDGR